MLELLRNIPSVNQILLSPKIKGLAKLYPRTLLLQTTRAVIEGCRRKIIEGLSENDIDDVTKEGLAKKIEEKLAALSQKKLKKVINCTGIIIHTNLARAPLSKEAARSLEKFSQAYSNLEYDLVKGKRGSRSEHCSDLLRTVTGAQDALLVNNNAAALLLTLSTLSKRKEVLVSRGEIVEIGGGFRVNEICKVTGALLKELGTTNKTRISDYETAISERSGLILKVHTSNFRIEGFSQSTDLKDIAALGRKRGLPVVYDAGSGLLEDISQYGPFKEPIIRNAVNSGADVVTFSGDKLLGGPQCGIIVGSKKAVDAMKKNPLYRALRVCKMTIAAMESTLLHYVKGDYIDRIPVLKMISAPIEALKTRAHLLASGFAESDKKGIFNIETRRDSTFIGGGSCPGDQVETWIVSLKGNINPLKAAGFFRELERPVITRVEKDCLIFDTRTIFEEDCREIIKGFRSVINRLCAKGMK